MFTEDEVITLKSFSYSDITVSCFATVIARAGVLEVLTQVDTNTPVVTYFDSNKDEALQHFDNFVKVVLSR